MPEIEEITWRELTGNKFNVGLQPAMLSDAGYFKQRAIRKIGDVQKSMFRVHYDREYVFEYLTRNLCKPLFSLGKDNIIDIVSKCWQKTYPNAKDSSVTLPKHY